MKVSIILHVSGNLPERSINIRNAFSLLERQTYQDYEFVIVEQSTDGQTYWNNGGIYQSIYNEEWSGAWCRNVGAEIATGDILFFVDADAIYGDDYIERVLSEFDTNMGYLIPYTLCIRPNYVGRNHYLKYNHYSDMDEHLAPHRFSPSCRKGCGAIMVMTRAMFNQVGGWNEALHYKEDKEICRRLIHLTGETLHTMDYVIGDLPHERISPTSRYVEFLWKNYLFMHPGEVMAVLRNHKTSLKERCIIDWLYYFYYGEIRYIDKSKITIADWLEKLDKKILPQTEALVMDT